MFVMRYRHVRVHVHPLVAIIELIIIGYIVRILPFLAGLRFNFIDYALISVLIFGGSIGSLFLHEYGHLLAARCMHLPIKGITLSLVGAYTSFEGEPSTAKTSFMISAAGPLMNILTGIILFAAHIVLRESFFASTIFFCLSGFNAILGVFNLLPVMPLDGGCIVRSVFWGAGNDLMRSNRMSFDAGNVFIAICFLTGLVNVVESHPVVSVICFVLGLSLGQSARATYRRMMTERLFSMMRPKSNV